VQSAASLGDRGGGRGRCCTPANRKVSVARKLIAADAACSGTAGQ